jgi:hypothetical protein
MTSARFVVLPPCCSANGEATRSVIAQVERVGRSIGYSVLLFPSWSALILRFEAIVKPKGARAATFERKACRENRRR